MKFDTKVNDFKIKTNPKISVVVPTLNQGSFIERTIKSILNQKYQNKEIVVVDGLSTDMALEIIKGFKNQIKWISEKDKGQADAINKGFDRCNGEIMAWINLMMFIFQTHLNMSLNFLKIIQMM